MIEITEYTMFGKDGILIKYDDDKEIFFIESEAEEIKDFLNSRTSSLNTRILKALKVNMMTLSELSAKLDDDKKDITIELDALEFGNRITIEDKAVDDPELGLIFVPLYKIKRR